MESKLANLHIHYPTLPLTCILGEGNEPTTR